MKIPKIEKNPKKSGIIYPEVTNWDVIKEYWKSARVYRLAGFCVFIFFILSTISQSVVAPIYYKKFFDLISNGQPGDPALVSLLASVVIMILGLNMASWICSRSAIFFLNVFEAFTVKLCVQRAFDYLIGHSHSFFVNNFTGSLVQRANRFGRSFIRIGDRVTMDIAPLIIKVTGAIIVLYFVLPIMAYGILIWVSLFTIASFLFARFKMKYDMYSAEFDSKMSGTMSDSISNHDPVQLFTGWNEESRRLDVINSEYVNAVYFRWSLQNAIEAFNIFFVLIIEFFIFYYGIKYWDAGLLTVGTFALLQAYIITIGGSLRDFGRVVRDLYEAFTDAKEMVEILHLKHEIQDIPNAKKLMVPKGIVEFKNVSFAFGENKPVFTGINVSIKQGEKVALIGSSGAGKSTLVKLLLRLYDIQKGEILVDGQDIKNVTQKSLRENISLVPQDPALFHRTLMENIRYGKRTASDEEVIKAAKLAHCDEFINEFPQKYETFVGERGVKLSGGERQRVAIARAILKNAPILVLDEATSSLDSHSESLIQDALHTLMEGKTTIVIAHRLSTIKKMDRIIVISKEGVMEEGSHDELIQKPGGIYAKLWSLQAGGFASENIDELL